MTNDFQPGERYPLTERIAMAVLAAGWPVASGQPDLTRGRRFLKAPADWEFWLTDGRKVDFSYSPHAGMIVGVSKKPDPERPEPLTTE